MGSTPLLRLVRLDAVAAWDPDSRPANIDDVPEEMFALMVGVRGRGPLPVAESIRECAARVRSLTLIAPQSSELRLWLVLAEGPRSDGPVNRHLGLRRRREALEAEQGFPMSAWATEASVLGDEGRVFAAAAPLTTPELLDVAVLVAQASMSGGALIWTTSALEDPAQLGALLEDALDRPPHLPYPDVGRLPGRRIAAGDVIGLAAGDVDGTERRIDWLGTRDALQAIATTDGWDEAVGGEPYEL